jgi:hypothetical protein
MATPHGLTCKPLARPLTFGRRKITAAGGWTERYQKSSRPWMRGTYLRIGHCRHGRITEGSDNAHDIRCGDRPRPCVEWCAGTKSARQCENNPGAPVAGANSFTERQAKSRIESKGYTNVSGLKKDDKGVWRCTAMSAGKSVDVSLDFQGNVVAQ